MRDADGRVLMWIGSNTEIDDVKRARDDAEQANRAKDQFLANLSHELRTPLTPVLMCVSSLEREAAIPAEYRDQLTMMRRNVELEARLIDDLLDLTRISRGRLHLELATADLHSLLAHTEEIVRSDARAKQIDLRLQLAASEHRVRGDSARLHQVFWNILKNAIKFTPAGGRVTVRTTNPVADRIRLEFADTGIGIEAQFLDSVFDPFVQGNPESSPSSSGLGLGMSISKAIIEMHGGAIHVVSAGPRQGATFTLEMPTAAAEEKGASLLPEQSPTRRTYRLLVVEDHPATLEVLSRLLRRQGHEVVTATTVQAARQAAARQTFDLLISDIGLPDGSGTDLMAELTRDHGLRGIAFSGYGMEDDLQRAKEAGFLAHIVKPIDFARLNRILEEVASAA